MKYTVRVTETLVRTVVVEAESMQDAEDKVDEAYGNEKIVLDYDDFGGYEIEAQREAIDSDSEYYETLEE